MIFYLVKRDHAYTVSRRCPLAWHRSLFGWFRPVSYERLFRMDRAPVGTYIFTDLERLSPEESERAAEIWRDLENSNAGLRLLNHPTRSLRRFELMQNLREAGLNRFGVARLDESAFRLKFPVFVRDEDAHNRIFSDLVKSEDELRKLLADFDRRGVSRSEKIAVEYCDARGSDGIYRKYGVLVIGNRVIPEHAFFSKNWRIHEFVSDTSPAALAEEREYLRQNPHSEFVKETFRIAGLDFGRADIGACGGAPQLWEINTNPLLFSTQKPVPERAALKKELAGRVFGALRILNDPRKPAQLIRIRTPEPFRKRFRGVLKSARDLALRTLPARAEDALRLRHNLPPR